MHTRENVVLVLLGPSALCSAEYIQGGLGRSTRARCPNPNRDETKGQAKRIYV